MILYRCQAGVVVKVSRSPGPPYWAGELGKGSNDTHVDASQD